jgi:hypothetical protein
MSVLFVAAFSVKGAFQASGSKDKRGTYLYFFSVDVFLPHMVRWKTRYLGQAGGAEEGGQQALKERGL